MAPALTQSLWMDETVYLPPLIWLGVSRTEDGDLDPLGKRFPMGMQKDGWLIKWDQDHNPYGSLPQRGFNEGPALLTMPGVRVREVAPGLYGGATRLEEREILTSRESGTFADPLKVKTRLGKINLYLSEMVANRILQTWADLFQQGYFYNKSLDGAITHSYQLDNYSIVPVSAWASNGAAATPIDDLRAASTSLSKGTSSRFGAKSQLLMTDEGVNAFLATAQVRKTFVSTYGASYLAPFDNAQLNGAQPPLNGDRSVNKLLTGMGLPEIVPWNRGRYLTLTDAVSRNRANFQKFLGTTSAIWLGYRPDDMPLGEFTLARHTESGDAPTADAGVVTGVKYSPEEEWGEGLYYKVHYEGKMPNGYYIEAGLNAVPRVFYEDAAACVQWT